MLSSSHILCHKRDFFQNGSTCSFQPITILWLLPRVAEPLTGKVLSAASTHALVMPVHNLFRLSWWILQLIFLQFIPSHIGKFSRLLDTASLYICKVNHCGLMPVHFPRPAFITSLNSGTFAQLPRGRISLLKKIVWPSHLHTTYVSGNSTRWYNFYFSNRKFFFEFKKPKIHPTLLLCVLAVNGRPGSDPFMSRYVCHRWSVRHAHFLCLSGSLRSVFCQFYYCNF